jgi:hypothetical protein
MLLIAAAAAALATVPPPPSPTSATAQATATIRVIAAVKLSLGSPENPGAPPTRDSVVKLGDGTVRPAKIIDFQ